MSLAMLRIRFSRTGKVGQPSFKLVVAEHRAPVKGKFIEVVGNYLPARNPKVIVVNKERISYWISKGALPTDSVASLLKKEGMEKMEKYMTPRTAKRKKKGGEEAKKEAPAAAAASPKPAEAAPAA